MQDAQENTLGNEKKREEKEKCGINDDDGWSEKALEIDGPWLPQIPRRFSLLLVTLQASKSQVTYTKPILGRVYISIPLRPTLQLGAALAGHPCPLGTA